MPNQFPETYRAATRETGGCCPIEAGLLGRWPTTNAPTAASPTTAPQPAAAGRRRTPR